MRSARYSTGKAIARYSTGAVAADPDVERYCARGEGHQDTPRVEELLVHDGFRV